MTQEQEIPTPAPKRKIALVDLDGVVINSDARFQLADRITNSYMEKEHPALEAGSKAYYRVYGNKRDSEANRLDRLAMDRPYPKARVELATLEQTHGFEIAFLTSRMYDTLYEATRSWLLAHSLLDQEDDKKLHKRSLICKPEAKRYTKTVIWKMEVVAETIERYRQQGEEIILLIIDNNLHLMTTFADAYTTPEEMVTRIACSSLLNALGDIKYL